MAFGVLTTCDEHAPDVEPDHRIAGALGQRLPVRRLGLVHAALDLGELTEALSAPAWCGLTASAFGTCRRPRRPCAAPPGRCRSCSGLRRAPGQSVRERGSATRPSPSSAGGRTERSGSRARQPAAGRPQSRPSYSAIAPATSPCFCKDSPRFTCGPASSRRARMRATAGSSTDGHAAPNCFARSERLPGLVGRAPGHAAPSLLRTRRRRIQGTAARRPQSRAAPPLSRPSRPGSGPGRSARAGRRDRVVSDEVLARARHPRRLTRTTRRPAPAALVRSPAPDARRRPAIVRRRRDGRGAFRQGHRGRTSRYRRSRARARAYTAAAVSYCPHAWSTIARCPSRAASSGCARASLSACAIGWRDTGG